MKEYDGNKSHLTAISRTKISAPMKYLHENNLLIGKTLDYGCGRGFDADALGMEKYDPYYFPIVITGKFKTITCHYVLNVVDEIFENEIILKIKELLSSGGKAYISVRRDKFKEGFTSKGTYQRFVELNTPVENEVKNKYIMYRIDG